MHQQGKIIRNIVITFLVFIAIMLLCCLIFSESVSYFDLNYKDFNGGWRTIDNESIEIPVVLETKTNVPFIIKKTLPSEFDKPLTFSFRSYYQKVRVLLDGEVLYKYDKPDGQWFQTAPPKYRNVIDLPPDSSGKELTVEVNSQYKVYSTFINDIIYGTRSQIETGLLSRDIFKFLLCIGIIFIGISFALISIVKIRRGRRTKGLVWFALFVILTGIFIISDNYVFRFIVDNALFCTILSQYVFLIAPIPYLMYVLDNQNVKWAKVTKLMLFAVVTYTIVAVIIQFAHIADIIEMSSISRIIAIITQIYILGYSIITRKYVAVSVLFMIGLTVSIFGFMMTGELSYILYVTFYIYILYVGKSIITDFVESELDSEINSIKAEQATNKLLVTQIESHFFYHIMNTIRVLIKTNPDEAYKMIGDFSKYLRYKTDNSGTGSGLVKFSEEMKTINAYIDMEKISLGDKLRVVIDIENDDFYIPVLTIQPIVENAIKHGIEKSKGGGTLNIRTTVEESFNVITIQDDGVGYDSKTETSDNRKSTALENIRERLSFFGDNELIISSIPMKGTKVTVRLKKELGNLEKGQSRNENDISG